MVFEGDQRDRHPRRRGGRVAPFRGWLVAGHVLVVTMLLTACTLVVQAQEAGDRDGHGREQQDASASTIVISEGGTYSGRWESDDPDVPAVLVRTGEPVIIEDSQVRGPGHLIRADRGHFVDLTLRDVHGESLRPQEAGRSPGRFLIVDTYTRITIEDSTLEGTAGIYLYESAEGATVRIVRNRARNIDGRRSDGQGGFEGTERVQFVQLNRARGLRDSEIAWNQIVNEPGRSRVEDVISLFDSSGRADDPIRIHHNLVHGAFPADSARDPFAGGGIMLADQGGAYLHAYENVVVATSNYGIAIAGGHDNLIRDNLVVACGRLADGSTVGSQNVGIYIWNHARGPRFTNNRGEGNRVAWQGPAARNDWWVPDASAWEANEALHGLAPVPCEAEREAVASWRSAWELMQAEGPR